MLGGILGAGGWVKPTPTDPAAAAPAPNAAQPSTPRPPPSNGRAVAGSPLDRARAAIAAGAPREQVIERLRQNGIEPEGL